MEKDYAAQKKIENFFSSGHKKTYRKGEIIIRPDEDPSGIFFLESGLVKAYVITQKGEEVILGIYKDFSIFPLSWGVNGTLNDEFYEAQSTVVLYKVGREMFASFIQENSDVLYFLLKDVLYHESYSYMRMKFLMFGSVYCKVIVELLIHAQLLGQKKSENAFVFYTQEKELAAHAGTTRESVSRELQILKKKHLISYEKGMIEIENIESLREELTRSF